MMPRRAVSASPGLLSRLCLPLLVLLLAVVRPAIAQENAEFTLSGFGTLGAARMTSSEAQYVRELSQPQGATTHWDPRVDSVLGLQANWRLRADLEAVVQLTSRYRYDASFTPDLSWAYLKYGPTPQVSLRAGRMGTEFFMLADSRMVGYSILTVRPPGDFFWYLPFYSIDGTDVAVTLPVGEHLLRGKLFYGVSDGSIPLGSEQWKIDGSTMSGGYLDYQAGAWLFRASYASIRFKRDMPIDKVLATYLPPALVQDARSYLAAENSRSNYASLGAIYDSGPWQVQLMYNRIHQGSQIFESSWSAYALAGYRIGQVTPYAGYMRIASDARAYRMNPVVSRIMADSHADQYTTILGARWDVARNIALKAQWDGIHGKPESIFPVRLETPNWSGKADVFSMTMDFIF